MRHFLPRTPGALPLSLAIAAACVLAACSSTTTGGGPVDGGSDGPDTATGLPPTETNAPLGARCHCSDFSGCCATGLLCRATDPCNVKTATGCYTEGTCAEKQRPGEPCHDARECADPGASCVGSGVCFLSPSATIRCDASLDCPDGRTCVDSYCKVMNGETCFDATDCASRFCTAGKCN